MERWLPVVGYEGLYEVSNLGRVRSLTRTVPGRWGFQRRTGKVLKQSPVGRKGAKYWSVGLARLGRTRTKKPHVLLLEAFVGPRPKGLQACHTNGDAFDNQLENLRWDTAGANQRDSVAHGTHRSAKKTRCTKGHKLSGENLRLSSTRGKRACKACLLARSRVFNVPSRDPQTEMDKAYVSLLLAPLGLSS